MLARVLVRGHFTMPLPGFGKGLDLAILYDDYALNLNLPDSLCGARGRR